MLRALPSSSLSNYRSLRVDAGKAVKTYLAQLRSGFDNLWNSHDLPSQSIAEGNIALL